MTCKKSQMSTEFISCSLWVVLCVTPTHSNQSVASEWSQKSSLASTHCASSKEGLLTTPQHKAKFLNWIDTKEKQKKDGSTNPATKVGKQWHPFATSSDKNNKQNLCCAVWLQPQISPNPTPCLQCHAGVAGLV